MVTTKDIWEVSYNASSNDDIEKVYEKWASNYDRDVDRMGYIAPQITAEYLKKVIDNPDANILDVGCGTGLVAEQLKEQGYQKISGLDISSCMLEQAEEKNVYQKLICSPLEEISREHQKEYDIAVCVGTFTQGHVKAEGLEYLVNLTKSGGYVAFTIQEKAYDEYGFEGKIAEFNEKEIWKIVEKVKTDYLVNEEIQCFLYICQVA